MESVQLQADSQLLGAMVRRQWLLARQGRQVLLKGLLKPALSVGLLARQLDHNRAIVTSALSHLQEMMPQEHRTHSSSLMEVSWVQLLLLRCLLLCSDFDELVAGARVFDIAIGKLGGPGDCRA
jgi:hypothetical protein